MAWSFCPRCEGPHYEVLRTHSYCTECDYCEEIDSSRDSDEQLDVYRYILEISKALRKMRRPEPLEEQARCA